MRNINKTKISGHIKKNTLGTSNEISFSVLDAKKEATDQDTQTLNQKGLGRVSIFTINPKRGKNSENWQQDTRKNSKRNNNRINNNQGALSDNEAVLSRKKTRTRSKRILFSAITVCVLLILAALMVLYVNQTSHRNDYIGRLKEDVETVKNIDNQLEEFDMFVEDTQSRDLSDFDLNQFLTTSQKLKDFIKTESENLSLIKEDLQEIQDHLNSSHDIDISNDLIDAVTSRNSTIIVGEKVINEFAGYLNLYKLSCDVMNNVLESDSLVRDASSFASTPSEDSINKSIELSNQALDQFNEALVILEEYIQKSQEIFGVDSEEYLVILDNAQMINEYINLRIDAQNEAINADKGYLERNSAQIEESNALSNENEIKAAELISKNTDNLPSQVIINLISSLRENNESYKSWLYELAKYNSNIDLVDKYLG